MNIFLHILLIAIYWVVEIELFGFLTKKMIEHYICTEYRYFGMYLAMAISTLTNFLMSVICWI